MTQNTFEKNPRNRIRQAAKRGVYDRETINAILDGNLVGHVGLIVDAEPVVIPMLFARHNDELLFHGSTKSRIMRALCSGQPVCLSATTLDGLVLAKSLFHHSMNYRSVCVFGSGKEIKHDKQRLQALKVITEKTMPGRWNDARQPSEKELKATCLVAVKIDSASAKIRTGPPNDDEPDLDLPVWSGVVPIALKAGQPIHDVNTDIRFNQPDYLASWLSQFNQNENGKGNDEKGAFTPRATSFHSLQSIAGRQLKVYTICAADKVVENSVVQAGIDHVRRNVSGPSLDSGHGFITVHFGESIWLLVDIWKDDILCHFVYRSQYTVPNQFTAGPDDGTTACVWELEITQHERNAWVRHVMANPNNPDFESYLNDHLSISVQEHL